MKRSRLFFGSIFALMAILPAMIPAPAAAAGPIGLPDAIAADVASGALDRDDALLYGFRYVFAKDRLPAAYKSAPGRPLKCVTPMIAEFLRREADLSPKLALEIRSYIEREPAPDATASTFISPGGKFRFTYLTTGTNAVPSTDTDPANGVPDFVDRCASYLDYSWDLEVDQYGFEAPPIGSGYYEISFESMDSYGYTTVVNGSQTRIVLHNNFQDFPANDDPEGNDRGAAKVTCAHEFKHATQIVGSGWSEGGWVEVDATWMEDIAYDQVNDYYNYLGSGSPISAPTASLDSGSTGTGSYDDCVWQHWMSETWGVDFIREYWSRRIGHTTEAVLDSYDYVLQNHGSSIADGYAVFAAWNHATGGRAVPGVGYGEAADYPQGPATYSAASYPAEFTGSTAHLAANLVVCSGLSGEVGSFSVAFDGQDDAVMSVAAVITRLDGTGVIETIPLDADNDAEALLSVPLEEIATVGLAVTNSAKSGLDALWTVTVDEAPYVPQPVLTLDVESMTQTLAPDGTAGQELTIGNAGEAGSVLDYRILPMEPMPAGKGYAPASVSGSTISAVDARYLPGGETTLTLKLINDSPDDEWLTDATLAVPAGVSITAASDFTGGTYGSLVWNGETGDGVTATWHGDTGDPNYYGVIVMGQQALGALTISVPAGTSGPLTLSYTITGDQYGASPHSVGGTFTLQPRDPEIELTAPAADEYLAVGQAAQLTWTASQLATVDLDLSRDGGATWESIAAGEPNDGSYDWTVTAPASGTCRIRVSSTDDSVSDIGPGSFAVYAPVPWLTAAPAEGQVAEGGSQAVAVDFDAAGLATGDYPATLLVLPDGMAARSVGVVLTVADTGTDVPGRPDFALRGAAPNPFNPLTVISYSLDAAGPMRLDVLDARGRLVRILESGVREAGTHDVRWDGRDGSGRRVASGVYLVRLRSGGNDATGKMTLAR